MNEYDDNYQEFEVQEYSLSYAKIDEICLNIYREAIADQNHPLYAYLEDLQTRDIDTTTRMKFVFKQYAFARLGLEDSRLDLWIFAMLTSLV